MVTGLLPDSQDDSAKRPLASYPVQAETKARLRAPRQSDRPNVVAAARLAFRAEFGPLRGASHSRESLSRFLADARSFYEFRMKKARRAEFVPFPPNSVHNHMGEA